MNNFELEIPSILIIVSFRFLDVIILLCGFRFLTRFNKNCLPDLLLQKYTKILCSRTKSDSFYNIFSIL